MVEAAKAGREMDANDTASLHHFHDVSFETAHEIIDNIGDADLHAMTTVLHMWQAMNNLLLLEIIKRLEKDDKIDTSALFARSSYVKN
jgi:hypothetical protein